MADRGAQRARPGVVVRCADATGGTGLQCDRNVGEGRARQAISEATTCGSCAPYALRRTGRIVTDLSCAAHLPDSSGQPATSVPNMCSASLHRLPATSTNTVRLWSFWSTRR